MASRLILGLGNPGPDYAETRHNVGYAVVDEVARRRRVGWSAEECRTLLASVDEDVKLGKPLTFMNRSGLAARCLLEHRELAPSDILVVFDDIHLPLGRLRLRPRGGPGGHRGLGSVIESLRTDEVPRLRLGVGRGDETPPVGDELVDFVLGAFEDEERDPVTSMIGRAADACESWLEHGTEETMNRFNG